MKATATSIGGNPPGSNGYTEGLRLTAEALRQRAWLHRNLVIAISALTSVSLMVTVFFRLALGLSGLVFVVPLVGIHLLLDYRCIRVWSQRLGQLQGKAGVDISILRKAVSQIPNLPARSLESMFSSLPSEDTPKERAFVNGRATGTRGDLADVEMGILLGSVCLTAALGAGVATLFFGPWPTLAVGALAFASFLLVRRRPHRHS
jgi:hypothetical protein